MAQKNKVLAAVKTREFALAVFTFGLFAILSVTTNFGSAAGWQSYCKDVSYLCRLPAARPDIGININLEAITAVVLGGTSIIGGIASIEGTVLSILILGVLRKGLSLIGLGGDKYNFILGIILVVCLIGFSFLNGQITLRRKKANA